MRSRPPWLGEPPQDTTREMFAAMTPEQRMQHFVQACALAHAILVERADAAEVLKRQVPLSAESEAAWLRLVVEGRRARAA